LLGSQFSSTSFLVGVRDKLQELVVTPIFRNKDEIDTLQSWPWFRVPQPPCSTSTCRLSLSTPPATSLRRSCPSTILWAAHLLQLPPGFVGRFLGGEKNGSGGEKTETTEAAEFSRGEVKG
jgi:hypothetical protein